MKRNIAKKILPDGLFQLLKRIKYQRVLKEEKRYQNKLMLNFSSAFANTRESALASLMITSHVLEKGITMPNRRLGFGYDRVRQIVESCKDIIERYGSKSIELQSALADLKQYYDIHKEASFRLPADIESNIIALLAYLEIDDANCWETTKEEYFEKKNDFAEFAASRHSIRWFSNEPIDDEILMKAIKLAQTAPSACNRQASRLKVISSPEGKKLCCELQNGNRGFGNMADKWLLVTADLSAWALNHPYSPYIDGGIFAMNLLYALHYYGIVACALNAHLTIEQRERLQKFVGYQESEVPIVFIVIGNPQDKFMVPKSRRLDFRSIIQEA